MKRLFILLLSEQYYLFYVEYETQCRDKLGIMRQTTDDMVAMQHNESTSYI